VNYGFAYSVGFHPWEDAFTDSPFVETITRLFEREEGTAHPPFGRALDIGTGSGVWGVELAKRGWDMTGDSEGPGAGEHPNGSRGRRDELDLW